ncbi:hypothetical protein GXW83_24035 [Streptacidiphilus sp. PB12-B1b]|uniref:hypothetical protein n=1 Tax=Streptacidiphilus sp. PB12-B1b TaxID=2705012 RepID=UPI0015FE49BF|nr:hypothetical protein [Streptacidiphilus sp. PB12-B1b]QMU78319.1 hypothetical protein GXW83_24035 [Streptacidiphilus sp. PB12-B1b]
MHVVILGAVPDAVGTLLCSGHEVSMLFDEREAVLAQELTRRVDRSARVESYADVDSLLAALGRIGATARGVDAVVALTEFAVLPAAVLGSVLGARALDPDVALRCRDKALQKAAWRRAGIPTANWTVVPGTEEVDARPALAVREVRRAGLKGPFIVKPLASAGSRGVRVAEDDRDLAAVVGGIVRDRPSAGRLLVEERNQGDEWHFDGLVRGGRVEGGALLVSRYLTPLIETRNGCPAASASFHPVVESELYEEAVGLTTEALRAVGLSDGAFHFEVFGGPGRFVAGELAARPGGGWIRRTVRAAIGVDLSVAGVLTVTGDPIEIGTVSDDVYGWMFLPSTAGRLSRIRQQDISNIAGVAAVELSVRPGEVMPDMRLSSGIGLGSVLVRAEDHEACEGVLREVIGAVRRINGEPVVRCMS